MSAQSYIYLCRNHRNGYTKIGLSSNPSYREKTLQSEEPEVSFIAIFHGDYLRERALHEQFQRKRLRGEWFDLSAEDVANIIAAFTLPTEDDWESFYLDWHDPEDLCIEGSSLALWEPPVALE